MAVGALIPVLAPIVGVASADPLSEAAETVHQQSGEVTSVGRPFITEGLSNLPNARMMVGGIPVNCTLPAQDAFQ